MLHFENIKKDLQYFYSTTVCYIKEPVQCKGPYMDDFIRNHYCQKRLSTFC